MWNPCQESHSGIVLCWLGVWLLGNHSLAKKSLTLSLYIVPHVHIYIYIYIYIGQSKLENEPGILNAALTCHFHSLSCTKYSEPLATEPVAKQVLKRVHNSTSSFWTRQHVQVRALKDVLGSLIVIFCPSLLLSARIIMTFHGKIDVITEEPKELIWSDGEGL